MFIQTEATPNPNSLKFIPGIQVSPIEVINFINDDDYLKSPLAKLLKNLEGVKSVFFGADFITITKEAEIRWEIIKPDILLTIMDYIISDQPILIDPSYKSIVNDQPVDDITKQIIELIETRVRPAVAQDGGDIIFKSFDEGIVKLELHGSCSGCPSSTITLKSGIENMLRHYIPEVIAVESV